MKPALLLIPALIIFHCTFAQKENLTKVVAGFPVNYEEELVGTYTLPDVLKTQSGLPVKDARTWNEKRRPEIVALFEEHQFDKWYLQKRHYAGQHTKSRYP